MDKIHVTPQGTYHPAPDSEIAWTVNDTRGYTDGGPACDECGACECDACDCGNTAHDCAECNPESECIGLSFTYICLDGGESLCSECFDKERPASVLECNC
jgi:hypothetical protein